MKSVKLKLYPNYVKTVDAFQTLDIKFGFVNAKYEEVSNPSKCRDFLGDCIWSMKTGNEAQIYGFQYNYADMPYDLETTRFSLQFPNEESKGYFLTNLPQLHEKEAKAGVKLTEVFTTNHKDRLIIEADKSWQSNLWKLSLYTFYIKMISYKDIKHLKDPESDYIKELTSEKETKLLDAVTKEVKEIMHDNISIVHNYSGFYSLLQGTNETAEFAV